MFFLIVNNFRCYWRDKWLFKNHLGSPCISVYVWYRYRYRYMALGGFPGGAGGKEPACQCRRHDLRVWYLGWEDPLDKGMTTHCSVLAWRIPWKEEPSGLQSIGSQRVRHNWSDLACMRVAIAVDINENKYSIYQEGNSGIIFLGQL